VNCPVARHVRTISNNTDTVVARLAIAPYGELVARTRDRDACPGALQLHQAADGALARLRLPGGVISAAQLEALAHAATEFGLPAMELTSRGNIQLRAITDTSAVAEIVAAAMLVPSQTHERVRNIVASPLSGRLEGSSDIRGLVADLDEAIQSTPELADLAGRFLFGLDDGRGDISGLVADAGAHFLGESTAALLLAGRDTGVRLDTSEVVPALGVVATRFAAARGKAWRVAELADVAPLLEQFTAGAEPTRPSRQVFKPALASLAGTNRRVRQWSWRGSSCRSGGDATGPTIRQRCNRSGSARSSALSGRPTGRWPTRHASLLRRYATTAMDPSST